MDRIIRRLERIPKKATRDELREKLDNIAVEFKRDRRFVGELKRVIDKGSPALLAAVRCPDLPQSVVVRVGGRAASRLPKIVQDELLPALGNADLRQGLKIVREAEKERGIRRPGRKPSTVELVPDARSRVEKLAEANAVALKADPRDERARGRQQVIDLLVGKRKRIGSLFRRP